MLLPLRFGPTLPGHLRPRRRLCQHPRALGRANRRGSSSVTTLPTIEASCDPAGANYGGQFVDLSLEREADCDHVVVARRIGWIGRADLLPPGDFCSSWLNHDVIDPLPSMRFLSTVV